MLGFFLWIRSRLQFWSQRLRRCKSRKIVSFPTDSILSIEPKHILKVSSLPMLHKDPVDRLIIAQAIVGDIAVISADKTFSDYEVTLL